MSFDARVLAALGTATRPLDRAPHGPPWNADELTGLADLSQLRDAAVLVPLIRRADGYTVLLTERTRDLKHHAGQVSFPGGRLEPCDGSPLACALRETFEEIGIAAAAVRPVGYLDPLATITGFRVIPVVGIIDALPALKVDPREVASTFEAPLAHLLARANQERHAREFMGRTRHFHVIEHAPHRIWGATASMIVNLTDRLERAGAW